MPTLILGEAKALFPPQNQREPCSCHSVVKENVPASRRNTFPNCSGPEFQQIGPVGLMGGVLGITSLVASEVVPGECLERLLLWLFLMETLEIIRRMLFNSYPVTAFLQEIIDSECIVLLIQFDKGSAWMS